MPLFASTILLSAFLLFLVQPIIAKQILPWFGGTSAVWTTCMVFFQVLLLAGLRLLALHHTQIQCAHAIEPAHRAAGGEPGVPADHPERPAQAGG
jgi:hypothetical protein